MKHTPGPWYWTLKYPTLDGRNTWTLVGGDGPSISRIGILSCDGERNSPHKGNIADVTLIEAAPDLLAACRVAMLAFESIGRESTDLMSLTANARLAEAVGHLVTAIRKAEGGAL